MRPRRARREAFYLDNYLSYRWPAPVQPDWSPEGPPLQPKKRRRGLRVFMTILLVLALLAALAAGGWFGVRYLLNQRSAGESTDPDGSGSIGPLPSLTLPEEAGITVPRAEVGLGVTLELDETSPVIMAPQAIYSKVLPSMVSVTVEKSDGSGYGAGSGVIMREDGYILTNYHVIEKAADITVMLLADDSIHEASLVGYDEEYDIALLKIEAQGLAAAQFSDSDDLKVGDTAYAIGNPLGYLYGTMTEGIISALTRGVTVGGYDMTLIQTSAALNSGNSGGALVNAAGQVVGITVAKISGQTGGVQVEGLAFAIPITDVRPFINRILETGETWRPTIGINCYAVTADGIPGILIDSVEPGTPAMAAGLRGGDFIIAANGAPSDSLYSLKRVLNEVGVGGTVTCTILRDGEELELTFQLVDSAQLDALAQAALEQIQN